METLDIRELDREERDISAMLAVWKTSVEATHTFLSAQDITALVPDVEAALTVIPHLAVAYSNTAVAGFIGVDTKKIEMLFVDPLVRGQGIGKKLIHFADTRWGVKYLDANEDNHQGIGFYEHLGFKTFGRSETDGKGRPFPLLHMKR